MDPTSLTLSESDELEGILFAWLDAKRGRTQSARTAQAYEDTLLHFRSSLHAQGLTLASDPVQVALAAQHWAGRAWENGAPVSAATYNLRISILSSFYQFALRRRAVVMNPLTLVERRRGQENSRMYVLDEAAIKEKLQAIDRRTPEGARDYALLVVAFFTGRRLAELASLRWGQVEVSSQNRLLLHFPRCKGGKAMRDVLPPPVAGALLSWLHCFYQTLEDLAPTAPLWVCLSNRARGAALTHQSIGQICLRRLGTSKVHTTRHSFALAMMQAGAKVNEVAAHLGHSNPAVTGRYLLKLKAEANPYSQTLVERYGLLD
jgi:site-specific recombinase XerD